MNLRTLLRGGLAALLLVGLTGIAPEAASAAAALNLGFSSDAVLVGGTTASRAPWITRALNVGGKVVRVNVPWAYVAPVRPNDPTDSYSDGYNWSSIDPAVRDLSAQGLRVCLMLYKAPTWAEGPNIPSTGGEEGAWRPNPTAFARFATAAARRYDGHSPDPLHPGAHLPRVSCWQGWNEPNINFYLAPQWVKTGRNWQPVAVNLYRQLLNAFYAAVKAVSPSNAVVMAGTAPIGYPPGTHGAGIQRTSPVAFYRELFCLKGRQALKPDSHCAPVHLDGIDHHPQLPNAPTWHAPNPDDAGVPDISRVTRVLNAAVRDGRVLPHGHKTVWVTELEWSSNPPHPGGVPMDIAAHWYEEAFYELWAQGVDTILPLELADPPRVPGVPQVFDSGLFFENGKPKEIATAYRFPFVIQTRAQTPDHRLGTLPGRGAAQDRGASRPGVESPQDHPGRALEGVLNHTGRPGPLQATSRRRL